MGCLIHLSLCVSNCVPCAKKRKKESVNFGTTLAQSTRAASTRGLVNTDKAAAAAVTCKFCLK